MFLEQKKYRTWYCGEELAFAKTYVRLLKMKVLRTVSFFDIPEQGSGLETK